MSSENKNTFESQNALALLRRCNWGKQTMILHEKTQLMNLRIGEKA